MNIATGWIAINTGFELPLQNKVTISAAIQINVEIIVSVSHLFFLKRLDFLKTVEQKINKIVKKA